ncbi:DUF6771 family protein [Sphingomonas adhaesiva]|uniref:DUF6771 family protein n=1 Tax=Sphingomonas adhaesiva TaxID=28212 RepID=UPI003FA7DB0E
MDTPSPLALASMILTAPGWCRVGFVSGFAARIAVSVNGMGATPSDAVGQVPKKAPKSVRHSPEH